MHDLTVIINAHSEGILAARTINAVVAAAAHCRHSGITVELIAVLDRPDDETRGLFARQGHVFDRVVEVAFADVGPARNAGVALASGRYVAFVDGDDLIAPDWLERAFRFYEASDGQTTLVLHPELSVYFGETPPYVWRHTPQTQAALSDLFEGNLWTALCFTTRAALLEVAYANSEPGSGFGYEDWHWNCETVARGYVHASVPGTAHFIRVHAGDSRRQTQSRDGAIIRPSAFFDWFAETVSNQRGPIAVRPRWHPSRLKPGFHRGKHALDCSLRAGVRELAHHYPGLQGTLTRLKRQVARREAARALRARMAPDWLQQACDAIHRIDPALRLEGPAAALPQWQVAPSPLGHAYTKLARLWDDAASHVFLLPWLVRGGADLGALHHITHLHQSGHRIVVVTTEPGESPWLSRIPEGVRVIALCRVLPDLTGAQRRAALLRVLLQRRPPVIHTINSFDGWELLRQFGRPLSQGSALYASVFCEDYTASGQLAGYAVSHLPEAHRALKRVFCDNAAFPARLAQMYGFDGGLFETVYFPCVEAMKPPRLGKHDALDIVWSGRLDRQKRPDLLYAVAARTPQHRYHVYGSPCLDAGSEPAIAALQKLPNVTFYGAYATYGALPHERFDLQLYTSGWDGLPNVLLEAAAAGLPLVAPAIGGIAEFVSAETGYLIAEPENVEGYVEAIAAIAADPAQARARAVQAQRLLRDRHAWRAFQDTLAQDADYARPARAR
jgi:glycosyltransferase involved in cell wall biosynthesis